MGLVEYFIKGFGSEVTIKMIKNMPWRKMGREQAKPFDTMLDSTFKQKKSEKLQKAIIKSADQFYLGFREGLLEDKDD